VLAPGAILTSLSGGRETASPRTSEPGAHDARPARERMSVTAPSRISATLGELLARPALHTTGDERDMAQARHQGWR